MWPHHINYFIFNCSRYRICSVKHEIFNSRRPRICSGRLPKRQWSKNRARWPEQGPCPPLWQPPPRPPPRRRGPSPRGGISRTRTNPSLSHTLQRRANKQYTGSVTATGSGQKRLHILYMGPVPLRLRPRGRVWYGISLLQPS